METSYKYLREKQQINYERDEEIRKLWSTEDFIPKIPKSITLWKKPKEIDENEEFIKLFI